MANDVQETQMLSGKKSSAVQKAKGRVLFQRPLAEVPLVVQDSATMENFYNHFTTRSISIGVIFMSPSEGTFHISQMNFKTCV